MSNAIKVVVGGVLLAGVAYALVKTTKTANAAESLDADIEAFSLKSTKKNPLGIPTSFIYTVSLKINNPSDADLTIGKPYIKLFMKKADGTLSKIANTDTPEGKEIKIKAKSSSKIEHDIEIRSTNIASVAPDLFRNIASRLFGDSNAPIQAVADVTIDAMGLTIQTQKNILL